MSPLDLAVLALAAAGWLLAALFGCAAWKSRGEAARAVERAGIAAARAEAAAQRSADSDLMVGIVVAQRQALELELAARPPAPRTPTGQLPAVAAEDLIESTAARLSEHPGDRERSACDDSARSGMSPSSGVVLPGSSR